MTKFWRGLRHRLGELPFHLIFLIPNLSVLFLLYYLAANALKPKQDFFASEIAVPTRLSFDALRQALFEGNMLVALRNSIVLTTCSVALSVMLGAAAAYAFSRLRLRFKTAVFVAMLIPMSISPLIVSIPLFAQLARFSLINTLPGGVLAYVGLQLSFVIYILDGVFRDIPDEVVEAARMDGAKHVRIFFVIVLPLALPGLVTAAIFVMLGVWNDLLVGLLLISSQDVIPITANVVAFQQKFSSNPQMVFAGLLLSALPMLLVYVCAQRFFIRGLSGGAYR